MPIFVYKYPKPLYSLYDKVRAYPAQFRQFRCNESLVTVFNCPLENKMADAWSHYNYIVYVIEGRKIWHTSHGSYDLRPGSCVFVRKGACIIEQFFDTRFCLMLFFLPDDFICEVLKSKARPILQPGKRYDPVMPINASGSVHAFYHSMVPYFDGHREPDASLLELKFKELVLTVADDPANEEVLTYFASLLQEPQHVSLQRVMDDNFCFNLKLEEYARLSARSLSAFKRDFLRQFHTSPGKWLMEKRLTHSLHLLSNLGKAVSDAAFESGFESASHFSRAFRQRFGMNPTAVKMKAS